MKKKIISILLLNLLGKFALPQGYSVIIDSIDCEFSYSSEIRSDTLFINTSLTITNLKKEYILFPLYRHNYTMTSDSSIEIKRHDWLYCCVNPIGFDIQGKDRKTPLFYDTLVSIRGGNKLIIRRMFSCNFNGVTPKYRFQIQGNIFKLKSNDKSELYPFFIESYLYEISLPVNEVKKSKFNKTAKGKKKSKWGGFGDCN
jgi:hypothetical protein